MIIPENVRYILKRIESFGFSAYVVGGCVRDSLMNVPPHDYDIASSASPKEIHSIFSDMRVIDTGIKHGTVGVVYNNTVYEITTFRSDGNYSDGRHPDSVVFEDRIDNDLARRDFTINAMAADSSGTILDLFGGCKDILSKTVKAVGNPDIRFNEDSLRILRAARFASVLDFKIDRKTSNSMHRNACLLDKISAERIREEIEKTLKGKAAGRILKRYPDIFTAAVPRLQGKDVSFISNALKHADNDNLIIWSLFSFYITDGNSSEIESLLYELRTDKKTRVLSAKFAEIVNSKLPSDVRHTAYFMSKYGNEFSFKFGKFVKCISYVDNDKEKRKSADRFLLLCEKVVKSDIPLKLSSLAVNGKDIQDAGIKDGKKIGEILDKLLSLVIEGKAENSKEKLLYLVKTL